MDFTTASVDALLTYWSGWQAAKAGEGLDIAQTQDWAAGWHDWHIEQAGQTGPLSYATQRASQGER